MDSHNPGRDSAAPARASQHRWRQARRRPTAVGVTLVAAIAAVILLGSRLPPPGSPDGAPTPVPLGTATLTPRPATATSTDPAPASASASPTVPPSTVPPRTSPVPHPAAGLSADQALRALLNPVTMTRCIRVDPAANSTYPDAAVRCAASDGRFVYAWHFPDRSALDRRLDLLTVNVPTPGSCDAGAPAVGRWIPPQGGQGGALLCFWANRQFVVLWAYDAVPVAVSVQGSNAVTLVRWWRGFDPLTMGTWLSG